MNRVATTIALLLGLTSAIAAVGRAEDPPPAEQYKALVEEFYKAARGLYEAKDDDDRMQAAELGFRTAPRCLELANKYPDDPVALDALIQATLQEIWLENNTKHPGWGMDNPLGKAVTIMLRDHLESEKMAEATRRIMYGFSEDCESLLRAVLEKSPHREVRGAACLRLAQFLNTRWQRLQTVQSRPEMTKRYEGIFGKEYLDELKRQDRGEVLKEIEALFERAADEFADAPLPYGGGVGEKARLELFELRQLSVGRTAQEIEGLDQDGVRFKLSDYRGQVVLLYFWSEY